MSDRPSTYRERLTAASQQLLLAEAEYVVLKERIDYDLMDAPASGDGDAS